MRVKTETIEEFIARGGKVTHCPTQQPAAKESVHRKPTTGHASILDFGEAELLYSETKVKKTTSKPRLKIDLNALPDSLKSKYIARLAEENDE